MNAISKLQILLFALIIFSFNSCTEDSADQTGPILSFETGTGLISINSNLNLGEPVKIVLKGIKSDHPMNDVTVFINGSKVPIADFTINGNAASANPLLLFNADRDQFSFEFGLGTSFIPQTLVYEFVVSDSQGAQSKKSIEVNFAGTVITKKDSLSVWNFSGPNMGGIDLVNLKVVPGTDPSADIRDAGIVDPLNDQTWIKKFIPLKGNVIRKPDANFNFDNAIVSAQVKIAFEAGTVFDPGSDATKTLTTGDVFVVKFNSNEYAAIKINSLVETSTNNLDYYILSIKK